jgi:multiple sugar transport system substrate-binding protein
MKKRILFTAVIIALITVSIAVLPVFAAKTKVTVWNFSQEQKGYYDEMAAKFEAENPNIEIEWLTYALDQYKTSLPMALRGDSGPDIFYLAPETDPYNFLENNWIQPIGDYLDDEYLAMFDEREMIEGKMYFDNELYTLPNFDSFVRLNGMMFYNKNVMEKAGLDPEKDVPKTFSEFRSVLKTITEAGNGQYYGIAWAGKPASEMHRILIGMFGSSTVASADARFGYPGFDYRDGQFRSASEEHQEVYNLMQGIVDDRSIVPGWSSMDKPTARSLFAQGRTAFYFDGEWMQSVWQGLGYEDFTYGDDFGIASAPYPDDGRKAYMAMNLSHGTIFVSNFTEDLDATMKVYKWIHGKEFMGGILENSYYIPGNKAISTENLSDYRKRILELAANYTVPAPEPVSNNRYVSAVQWPEYHPDAFETMAAALTGDVDYVEEASLYDQKMQEALERNIKKAQDEGYDVSLDDYMFPDWNPLDK